ncbi:hypothetical protein [Pseudonocardia spinosispora]|uniref:hypothetical protein n=1 Tax=Pseudonocardia spinosispora TaxID=103441 RepID=UPI0004019F0E|nr:hypothetical protein [Pseudonocardia spinosispora]
MDVQRITRSGLGASRPPDELISDPVATRVLRPHLIRSGFFLAILLVFALGWGLTVGLAVLSSSVVFTTDRVGISPGLAAVLSPICLGGMACALLGWLVATFFPVREPITEFGALLDGDADRADEVYRRISDSLTARRTPFHVEPETVGDVPSIVILQDVERAVISVRAVGSDLFVGWVMWRNRSTARLLAGMLRDMIEWTEDSVPQSVRATLPLAMREMLHNVTREALQTP